VRLADILPHLIAAGLILLISFPVHEFAHAYTAYRLGDGTAKLFGRLTLNPVAHFDPFGGLFLVISSLIGFGIGWAKPTPVNPNNLRGGRSSEGIVAAAGPVSNLVLAALGAIPLRLLINARLDGTDVPDVVLETINFVPVPPLDGSKVLFSLMSPRQAWQWRPMLEQYGFLLLVVVAFLPVLPGNQSIFDAIFLRIGGPIINFLVGREVL